MINSAIGVPFLSNNALVATVVPILAGFVLYYGRQVLKKKRNWILAGGAVGLITSGGSAIHLGEFYFEKLRYHDAASAYRAFVALHPLHRSSPHFGMRVVEIYEAGGFPKLVLESKKEYAATYALEAE